MGIVRSDILRSNQATRNFLFQKDDKVYLSKKKVNF